MRDTDLGDDFGVFDQAENIGFIEDFDSQIEGHSPINWEETSPNYDDAEQPGSMLSA